MEASLAIGGCSRSQMVHLTNSENSLQLHHVTMPTDPQGHQGSMTQHARNLASLDSVSMDALTFLEIDYSQYEQHELLQMLLVCMGDAVRVRQHLHVSSI